MNSEVRSLCTTDSFSSGFYVNQIGRLQSKTADLEKKLKILFVCPINRMRSATAHKIFESDSQFEVDSGGIDKSAATVLEPEQLEWADAVVVMEKTHRSFIRHKYPEYYDRKKIICLYIPNDFDFMQPELITILQHKVADVYKRGLLG